MQVKVLVTLEVPNDSLENFAATAISNLIDRGAASDNNIQIIDIASAEKSSIVAVQHWEKYSDEDASAPMPFKIDVADQRASHGQIFMDIGATDGDLDNMICIGVEVATNPLTGVEALPCVRIAFDGDNHAFSLFKIGDKLLVLPETGVFFNSFNDNYFIAADKPAGRERFYWCDDSFERAAKSREIDAKATSDKVAEEATHPTIKCAHCGKLTLQSEAITCESNVLVCSDCHETAGLKMHLADWRKSVDDGEGFTFAEWMAANHPELHQCQNCTSIWGESDLVEIKKLSMRVSPGEAMPSGECPSCGCLAHPLEVTA